MFFIYIYIYIYMEHLFLISAGAPILDLSRSTYSWSQQEHLFLISAGERPAAAHLLRSWVRIPPGAWIFVCCECRVLSGRGLCDELITHPEESYRLWCVVVCDLETSRIGAPYIYDISSLRINGLNLILLTWRIWTPNNAIKWQMGFISAFKGLDLWLPYRRHPLQFCNSVQEFSAEIDKMASNMFEDRTCPERNLPHWNPTLSLNLLYDHIKSCRTRKQRKKHKS